MKAWNSEVMTKESSHGEAKLCQGMAAAEGAVEAKVVGQGEAKP